MFEFTKEMYYDERALGKKCFREKPVLRILQSPAIKVGCLKKSKTIFSSSHPCELCNRTKLLLQEKVAGNKSKTNIEENVAMADKLKD